MWTLARGGGGGPCRLAGLSLHLVTSRGQLEISHGGKIHTMGTGKSYKPGRRQDGGRERPGGRGGGVQRQRLLWRQ